MCGVSLLIFAHVTIFPAQRSAATKLDPQSQCPTTCSEILPNESQEVQERFFEATERLEREGRYQQ
jgi:hypothetical protein